MMGDGKFIAKNIGRETQKSKFEAQNPKSEGNPKHELPNPKQAQNQRSTNAANPRAWGEAGEI